MARSDIKAGSAYVELYTKGSRFQRGLNDARKQVREFGNDLKGMGMVLATASVAMLTPIALAVKQFSGFEDALNSLRASANPTADQLEKIRTAAMDLSTELKQRPTAIVDSFTELLKAGVSVESVLNGAGAAAVKFAKVGQLEVSQAATVMADAMTVFGTDANKTINTLSAAADASSISISQVAESFSMASAVAGLANQNLDDVSQAIAILGNNGLKGSDAGTSLKTMFLSLMAPTDKGAEAMKRMELNMRDASGEMLPLRAIIEQVSKAIEGMSAGDMAANLRDLFGTDALRAGAILLKSGTEGWDEFTGKMKESLTVSEKYETLNKSLSASLEGIWAAIEKLAISIGEALAPELQRLSAWVTDIAGDAIKWAQANQETIVTLTKLAVGVGAVGVALIAVGAAISAASASLGLLAALASPLGLVVAALVAIGATAAYMYAVAHSTVALADAMGKLTDANDKSRANDLAMHERLEQLMKQQSLTNAELTEAATIADTLEKKYGELGFQIDTNTGKVTAHADAYSKLATAMREQAITDVDKQLKESAENVGKLTNQLWRQQHSDDAVWFGVDEEAVGKTMQALAKAKAEEEALGKRRAELSKERAEQQANDELAAAGIKPSAPVTPNKDNLTGGEKATGPGAPKGKHAAASEVVKATMEQQAAAEEAAKESKKQQEELDKLEEQMAKKRRTRVEQEIHEIKTLANERRKLLDESGAGVEEYMQNEMDAAAAIADVKKEAAKEESKERERVDQEKRQSDREMQAQIDSTKIDLDKSLTDTQKEVAKLDIEKGVAMAAAMEAGDDPEKVAESFDLRKQLAQQKGTGDQEAVAGTFSAAAAEAMGRSGGPEQKMVKSLDEIRKLAKQQYEEQKRQRREGSVFR